MKTISEALYAIALTLWIGGLWAIGGLVAPTLFHSVPERALAGMLAGKLFMLIAYVGVGCALYLLVFRLVRFGGASFKHGIFWIVLWLLALTILGEFGVQPMLASLKHQALPKEVMETVLRDRFSAWL